MTAFIWVPSTQGQAAVPRVNALSFGDGCEQRGIDGIHAFMPTYELTFQKTSDIAAIAAFLGARGKVESFTWTPHGEAEAASFVCRWWGRVRDPGGVDTLAATFVRAQVCDPETNANTVDLVSRGVYPMDPGYHAQDAYDPVTLQDVIDLLLT